MQARSLVPLIEGGEGRARAFAEHARDMILKGTACTTMVRDRRWKLVHFVDSREGQLFDLDAGAAAGPGAVTGSATGAARDDGSPGIARIPEGAFRMGSDRH